MGEDKMKKQKTITFEELSAKAMKEADAEMAKRKVNVDCVQELVRDYDMHVHHGTCDSCGEEFCLVAHYGYTRKDFGFQLCTKCLGRGLVIFQHPSLVEKLWYEVFASKNKQEAKNDK